MATDITCQVCGRTMPDDIGAFYHRKECERREVLRQLQAATLRLAPPEEIASLLQKLEYVSDVGD